MKRSLVPLAALSIVLCGCGGSTTAVTPSAAPSPEPSSSAGSPAGDPVSLACDDVSFVLDPTLGSDYTCEILPELDDPYFGNPETVWIEVEGYPISNEWSQARIAIYPVADFAAIVPDTIPPLVSALQALIGGTPPPDQSVALPFLLDLESSEFFHAQYGVLPFESGSGIRYLTGFTQDMGTFGNPEIYTYQAITEDGRYWVSAVFSISHPMLPDPSWPPAGMTEEEFLDNYDAYVSDNVDQLNAQPSGSFVPTIDALDALVASITIAP